MGLLDRIDKQKKVELEISAEEADSGEEAARKQTAQEDPYLEIKRNIHTAIIHEMNKSGSIVTDRAVMFKMIDDHVNDDANNIPRIDRPTVATDLFNDIMGYGPIEVLV